jgi:hypothetical protein
MARKSSGGHIGRKHLPPSKYALGDAEEIAQRDSTAYQNPAANFQQLRPGDSSSNLNEPSRGNAKSGDFKFDNPY